MVLQTKEKNPQMEKKCINVYDKLHEVKKLHINFLSAYSSCAAKKDFALLRQKMDRLKSKIDHIKEDFPHLTVEQIKQLELLKTRFHENPDRHRDILGEKGVGRRDADEVWKTIEKRLTKRKHLIDSLISMEETQGEPDAIWYDKGKDEYYFVDCSYANPWGRRLICYDDAGQKEANEEQYDPVGNAVDMATTMGIKILTEEQYRKLQTLGNFDQNVYNWLYTPVDLRKTGYALYGYRDNDKIVVKRGKVASHMMSWGFRGLLGV